MFKWQEIFLSFKGIIIVFFIFIASVFFVYFKFYSKTSKVLPIFQPHQINKDLIDENLSYKIGDNHTMADFTLFNQLAEPVSQEIVKNKVYVAEFFFATCPDICPLMNAQMARIAKRFRQNDTFRILSFSVYPEKDTPEKLLEYSKIYQAELPQWTFLTGDKKEIYALARQSYFLMKKQVVGDGDGGVGDFIHTNNFVLIDPLGRIRGYYDGTSKKEVDELMDDIQILLEEP